MTISKWIFVGLAALMATSLTSCNTFLGVGRDLQQAGEGIENTIYGRSSSQQTQTVPQSGY